MKRYAEIVALALAFGMAVSSCDLAVFGGGSGSRNDRREPDAKYVGQQVGNFLPEEWYPAGELGTTDNVTAGCYEDETPAVTAQGLEQAFNLGKLRSSANLRSTPSLSKGWVLLTCALPVWTVIPVTVMASGSISTNQSSATVISW